MRLLGPAVLGIALLYLMWLAAGLRVVRKDGEPMRRRDYLRIVGTFVFVTVGLVVINFGIVKAIEAVRRAFACGCDEVAPRREID